MKTRLAKILLTVLLMLVVLLTGLAAWTYPVQALTPTPGMPTWLETPTPEATPWMEAVKTGDPVFIYLFWGDGCPHCARAKPYFETLPEKFSGVFLRSFEVYYNQDNSTLFFLMAERFGVEQLAVPTFFIGPYYYQGYSEEIQPAIEELLEQCLKNGCVDSGAGIPGMPAWLAVPAAATPAPVQNSPTPQAAAVSSTSTPTPLQMTPTAVSATSTPAGVGMLKSSSTLDIPFWGTVDLDLQPAALSTALIAFVDGFNPCSLWVLSMLLALTLHTGSRKKVFAIGLIFLSVTAGIYALFIAGLFSVLQIVSFLGWIQILVAAVALFFGLVNIKDYFWYKEGISFTIADDKKPGLFMQMRKIMDASQSFWGLLSATIVLAVGVSLVEFSCTAGFPVLWVNLLSAQQITGISFVLLLLLYMVIYQLDELVIFFSAVITLKASRLEEKQGRVLKLIGGMLMLTLSGVMLFDPSLMNRLDSSLAIFGLAFGVSLLVLVVHRVIMPKWGFKIGN